MRFPTKGALVLLVSGLAWLALPSQTDADLRSDWFRKFPWTAGEEHYITTLPGDGWHTGIDATAIDYDLTLGDAVRSMSDGYATYDYDRLDCCSGEGHGLGQFVYVWSSGGGGRMATYAHLDWGREELSNTPVLQGDFLGAAGSTGHVEPSCPAYHLHVRYTDGWSAPKEEAPIQATSNFAYGTEYQSRNAPGGEIWGYFVPFPSIRDHYAYHGGWTYGWTHDVGRPGLPFPQGLYVHNYYTWGWEQTFANNPWYTGAIERGFYAGVWNPGASEHIEEIYWRFWNVGALVGTAYRSVSVPMVDRGPCPPGSVSTCAGYQLFHLGYMWNDWSVIHGAVWCPDVGVAHQHTKDGFVNVQDVVAVIHYVGCQQGGGPNGNGAYYDAWFDMDGSGWVNVQDVTLVLNGVGRVCHPT